jgi:hypothetical protein
MTWTLFEIVIQLHYILLTIMLTIFMTYHKAMNSYIDFDGVTH